jgi:hypothetical protein
MKKNILIVFLLAIFSSTVFSMSKNSVTVEGYISTYGNMPFTYLGITTSDDELYIIEASEKIMDKIENLKGTYIKLTGTVRIDENTSTKILTVTKVKKSSKR